MAIAKVRTHYNYNDIVDIKERRSTPIGESCTVPDQSLTIKEILQRFTSGIDPGVVKDVIYEENSNIDAPTNLINFDPTDSLTEYEKECLND